MKVRRIIFFYAVLLIISGLLSCHMDSPSAFMPKNTGSSGTYNNRLLPSVLMVKIPASLSVSSSDGTIADESSEKCVQPGHSYSYRSGGYHKIKRMVTLMEDSVTTLEIYGILSDAVISQNTLQPGTYENESITLTQELYDSITAQLPARMAPPDTMIGEVVTIPSLAYEADNSGTLVNSICISLNPKKILTYAWSADRTKLRMSINDNCRDITLVITYDSSTGSSAFNIADSCGDNLLMAIEHDSTSAANGVFARLSMVWAEEASYSVTGYADDNGGLVVTENTFPVIFNNTAVSVTFYFKEGFDGKGYLLLAETSTDGSEWTINDKYNDTSLITTYGENSSTAKTMDYKAMSLL